MPMKNLTPFTVVEMTDAINKLPAMPLRFSPLFGHKSVRTTNVNFDLKKGRIVLVSNQDRATPAQSLAGENPKPSTKSIPTTHLPQSDIIHPEDIQDMRAFGSNEPEVLTTVVNDKLQSLKNNIEMTKEWHRVGAVKGVILDADGKTEILDIYDFFGATKKALDMTFTSAVKSVDPVLKCILDAKRHVEAAMGGVPFQRIEAIVGADFYDMLTGNEFVRPTYYGWLERQAAFGDNDYRKKGFTYGGITFFEASEVVGGNVLVEAKKGHVYPVGAGIFTEYVAPANWMEAVNTYGKKYYARMDIQPNGRGVYVEGQSNPLSLCNFPEALVELTAV